jgi:uridine kinase
VYTISYDGSVRLIYGYSKKADIPIYNFSKHNREKETTTIYSPHVLILEGIFALHDDRVLDILDLKV